ncbi:type II toxin-antitoxin system PemK/MazF family toxin [Pseudanabaena sp. 'Roaring Creek']|uniref:type II toxin-antitoxin system PemK/MazF family toxin n=1 Tax=Pseudanabaena sp. 'Roaring Creek' TaxID=1681830 RepID=UPI0006D766B1|nr:type II toxin-antitoxin system PemK/MazF family toxin [Pseudanabaena sp. 'Roaring Creek']
MKRGDIYLVSLDPTEGHEQQGTRPVLIVSPDKFNALTKVPIVVPITSGGSFARTAGFAVSLDSAGTRTKGLVRCDQARPIDLSARKARRLESLPDAIVDDVLARIVTLFSP